MRERLRTRTPGTLPSGDDPTAGGVANQQGREEQHSLYEGDDMKPSRLPEYKCKSRQRCPCKTRETDSMRASSLWNGLMH